MSYHSNNNQEKCWSCEFFCGERKYKTGIFLGDTTETSSTGTCSCKRSTNFNKSVSETGRCSKYQKWGVIASAIAKKENEELLRKQKQENERYKIEMQEEQRRAERECRELERERIALEQERKKLEYERWYASLSTEDKKTEDLRIEEERKKDEREAEERRIRLEQEKKNREAQRLIDEKNAKKRKKKNLIVFISLIATVILLIVGISVGTAISNSVKEKQQQEAFNKSSTGLFTSYLSNKSTYKNGAYTEYVDIETRGRILMTIEYKKNGFVDNYEQTCDFRVVTTLLPKKSEKFSKIYGFFFFNLDGSDNNDSFGTWTDSLGTSHKAYPNYCAIAKYGSGSVLVQYQMVNYNYSTSQPEYVGSYYNYTSWDSTYNNCIDEWTQNGWKACLSSYIFANELLKEATGHSLYK